MIIHGRNRKEGALPLSLIVAVALLVVTVLLGLAVAAKLSRPTESEPPWGKPIERYRDFDAHRVAYAYRPSATVPRVSDRMWKDLSLDAVFSLVDRCITTAGQHALYKRLREPSLAEVEIRALNRRVQTFAGDEVLRQKSRTALLPLAESSTFALVPTLYGKLPETPRGAKVFPVVTMTTIATAAASVVWPFAFVLLIMSVVASIAIRFYLHNAMSTHATALASLVPLLHSAHNLVATQHEALHFELSRINGALVDISTHRAAMSWLLLDPLRMSEVAAALITYLNVFLLLDVHAFVGSLRLLRRKQSSFATLHESVGEIDAARSIASFRAGSRTSTPDFTERGSSIVVDGLVHPLVRNAVSNNVRLDAAKGWLVMGSNMSGKSTFLRAIALSALLAQSIGCVPAASYSAPLLSVRTLISVEDDVLAGRSYFLAEAHAAREMLCDEAAGVDRLCIIDELFRGTNTVDRVGASGAFLRALNRNGAFVVAATHDAELIGSLSRNFLPHYFQEVVDTSSRAITFDYRLREGPVAPRNALAVLELVGFPAEVLADARQQYVVDNPLRHPT